MPMTIAELYQRQVREIALLQCRCETGADIDADLPRVPQQEEAPPTAA